MKILRKGDDFKKMPEGNVQELLLIRRLLGEGWKYCSRAEYKDFYKVEKQTKEEKNEEKSHLNPRKNQKKINDDGIGYHKIW